MRKHEIYEISARVLKDAGINKHKVGFLGSSHLKLSFEFKGRTHDVILSNSPSDWRAAKNSRSLVRRKLREIGVTA
jgi:hypothetical protein